MCGITGIFAFNLVGKFNKIHVTAATQALEKRGPDFQDIYLEEWVALGHRRLSIIDTSSAGNQPMWDETNRYCIVFNGEIFNFRELRTELASSGVSFRSSSDTEVLLQLYIKDREKCLSQLNGFFAFCIYDKIEGSLFIARDRYGIKPLFYLFDEDKFIFSSELKSLLEYGVERNIDHEALLAFLQLNYIPAPLSIYKNVNKLTPGHYLLVTRGSLQAHRYYSIPYKPQDVDRSITYDQAKLRVQQLLESSVRDRLVADVPLGAFLSGGIDSSIIATLAKRHKPDLHTFSIVFQKEKYFDESSYSRLIAKHLGTEHTEFSIGTDDLMSNLNQVLEYGGEPFADSSALAVYKLCQETRKHATVALSGDGADELFSGYNKHTALLRSMHPGFREQLVGKLGFIWNLLPQSRSNPLGNVVRQMARFSDGMKLSPQQRYWRWAGFADDQEVLGMLHPDIAQAINDTRYQQFKTTWTRGITESPTVNGALLNDMELVLPNDMLTKVDLMSMANSLEVRVPFLDYRLVDFVFSLPDNFKINRSMRKRVLQDAFRDVLPDSLYNRVKKGFEVPLLSWFRGPLRLRVEELLDETIIEEQRIFDIKHINNLKKRLFSANPGDSHARIWGLVCFQTWWKKQHTRVSDR